MEAVAHPRQLAASSEECYAHNNFSLINCSLEVQPRLPDKLSEVTINQAEEAQEAKRIYKDFPPPLLPDMMSPSDRKHLMI
jgi:hypothetical protein